MSDNDNDIDGLLGYLSICADRYSCHTLPSDVAANYHAALTALVAERDALRERVLRREADINALADSNAILRERLEANPPADRDRDLRERLVCAALTGVIAGNYGSEYESAAIYAIRHADAVLAAMRKGEQP